MFDVHVIKKLALPTGETRLDVRFTVEEGNFVVLSGKSGAGKTTLLKILAGLVKPEAGTIRVGEETWLDTRRGVWVASQQRNVGLVFQDYALFPHLTVRQNLAFGLPGKPHPAPVDDMLRRTGLETLQHRYPATLSGGQQQRVALARTLVRGSKLLLLDEPFSALDAETKGALREELVRAHRTFGLTTVLVSHEPAEYRLADYAIELDAGRVVRQGKAAVPFQTPPGPDAPSGAESPVFGEVLGIAPGAVGFEVRVRVAERVVALLATAEVVRMLQPGDQVQVSTRDFSPLIRKV
ncbi:MAG: ATP-binding cassette domain-containing protein [Ferruginibacter sp.]|nr:ATP-binding cassette domain-containing protein [Cytophagales bacterium]